MYKKTELARVELPDFGLPRYEPSIAADTYRGRIERLRSRAADEGYGFVVVYADREHAANMSYLTGYDPRFEEALLIVPVRRSSAAPKLLVGNEGIGYVRISPIFDDLEVELFQSFSLLGQSRAESRVLGELLRDVGMEAGTRIGVAGWKHFGPAERADHETAHVEPSYIIDELRALAGGREHVRNANPLLMSSNGGLRCRNEAEQLGWFEFAATHASQGVRNLLFGLQPGMSEYEAATLWKLRGIPHSCHPMLSTGDRAFLGMGSPSSRRMERGDPFTTALGLWGALTSRAGFLVESSEELAPEVRDYQERLVSPYFQAVAAWYERLAVGVTGDELYRVVHDRIGDPFFGVKLNPGHLIHLDEWVDSPVYKGSEERIESGMALQVDVIPATGTAYFTSNIEDGVAIADESLRAEMQEKFPEAWKRIDARRRFMAEEIGIDLQPEVLPFSNIPAFLPPFLLAPDKGMRSL